MKSTLIISTFTLLYLCLQFVASEQFAGPQFSKLQKLAKGSPIIRLNSDTYKAYIMEPERNYSTFVLFTATHHKYNCGPCRQQVVTYDALGVSYAAHFGKDLNSEQFFQKPFFLAQIEPEDAMDIFGQYSFQTVPHFAHIAPGKKKVTSIPDNEFLRNPAASQAEFISFIQAKTGVEIEIYTSPLPKIMTGLALIAVAFVAIRLSLVLRNRLRDPMMWFVITMGLYFVVMAGVGYNLIRSPPYSEVNPQTGQVSYIAPQARTQYVAEGFIIASLMTAIGLLIVTIGDLVPKMKNAVQQRLTFWVASAFLFICLVALNNIFFSKYHLPAFRIHQLAGYFSR